MAPGKSQVAQQKSPAEFFAENQNIAGFDNVSIVVTLPVFASSRSCMLSFSLSCSQSCPLSCSLACSRSSLLV